MLYFHFNESNTLDLVEFFFDLDEAQVFPLVESVLLDLLSARDEHRQLVRFSTVFFAFLFQRLHCCANAAHKVSRAQLFRISENRTNFVLIKNLIGRCRRQQADVSPQDIDIFFERSRRNVAPIFHGSICFALLTQPSRIRPEDDDKIIQIFRQRLFRYPVREFFHAFFYDLVECFRVRMERM